MPFSLLLLYDGVGDVELPPPPTLPPMVLPPLAPALNGRSVRRPRPDVKPSALYSEPCEARVVGVSVVSTVLVRYGTGRLTCEPRQAANCSRWISVD